MKSNLSGYRFFEHYMTLGILVDAAIFLLYLIMAGIGAVAMKIIFAVLAFLISGAALFFLFTSKEMLKPRSFWMTMASAAIILCTLVSLLCRYPAP